MIVKNDFTRYSWVYFSIVYLMPLTPPGRFLADDQGYDRGGTPIFTDVFEPLARVALYHTDEDGLGTCFGAA